MKYIAGIRTTQNVINMNNWRLSMELIIQPFGDHALGDVLNASLNGELGDFHTFQAAIAFVKYSGVRHIQTELQNFSSKGKRIRIVAGLDHYGTSKEGLEALLKSINEQGEIWLNHNCQIQITFHPKLYFFEGDKNGLLIIGSGNLTEGGLYTNDEVSSINQLDFDNENDRVIRKCLYSYFDKWCDEASGNSKKLNQALLTKLVTENYIVSEATIQARNKQQATMVHNKQNSNTSFFEKSAFERYVPKIPKQKNIHPIPSFSPAKENTRLNVFVMTLQRTDVGTGQTTRGTSRRSPEIFIPLAARNYCSDFWGWPNHFIEDPARPGKFDRLGVRVHFNEKIINVNMMTWPVKHDFRLRSEALRSSGNIGDILKIKQAPKNLDFSYYVEVIPQGAKAYKDYLKLCQNSTRNSTKVWGYYNE
jgi:HKD family nuclease